jgi:hypothetical protein
LAEAGFYYRKEGFFTDELNRFFLSDIRRITVESTFGWGIKISFGAWTT